MSRSQLRLTKAGLEKLCKQGKSHRQIAKQLKVSTTTVGWWLHHYGLKSVYGRNKTATKKPKCKYCGATQAKQFNYGRKSVCRKCWHKTFADGFGASRRARRTALKYAAVQAKGGCCQRCGYSKNLAALQFHHPDRDAKHENWSQLFARVVHSSKHMPVLAAELEKCELLCANCHAEDHNPDIAMPICVSGKMMTYLAHWVSYLRHFFHAV